MPVFYYSTFPDNNVVFNSGHQQCSLLSSSSLDLGKTECKWMVGIWELSLLHLSLLISKLDSSLAVSSNIHIQSVVKTTPVVGMQSR